MTKNSLRNMMGMGSLVLALTSACSNDGGGADSSETEASSGDTTGGISSTDDGSTSSADGTDTSASGSSGLDTSATDDTTSGSTDDGETTSGSDSSGTESGGPTGVCDPNRRDDACVACTKASCCEPLEACYADTACACIADCIAASDDPGNALFECAGSCGAPPPVGLLLPIQECVTASCEVCTGSAEEDTGSESDTEDPVPPNLCEAVDGDGPCTSCTRESCCTELEACAEDEGCACIAQCLTAIDGTTEAEVFACATQCGVAPPANLLLPLGECRTANCEACTPEDPTEDPTDPTGGGSICEILPDDESCLGCTRDNCCAEVEECFADSECACMANCVAVTGGNPSDAIESCEQSCQVPNGGELLGDISSCQTSNCQTCATE